MLTLDLDRDNYSGGIAVWAAIDPAIQSTADPCSLGIHVHARETSGGPKIIDVSTDRFKLRLGGEDILVTGEMAKSYRACRVLGIPMADLRCLSCGSVYVDTLEEIPKRHGKRPLSCCAKPMVLKKNVVANPLCNLQLKLFQRRPKTIASAKDLVLDPTRYPGGVRIWGTGQAILWSAMRAEDSGIHVHAYDSQMNRIIDDTYGQVWYGGSYLPAREIQLYTVQQTFSSLRGKIHCLRCPHCNNCHLDDGVFAIRIHRTHLCEHCGKKFATNKGSNVSNCIHKVIGLLHQSS
jgi:hypothetical protein